MRSPASETSLSKALSALLCEQASEERVKADKGAKFIGTREHYTDKLVHSRQDKEE